MIPDEWIDVQHAFGGWLESEEDETYGSAFPDSLLVPRSEWRDRIREREEMGISLANYHPYVYNQHPESSCVYNAACGCLTIRRNLALGLSHQVVLSPMSGYCRVASYRHSGSTMWGALELTNESGVLPSDGHDQSSHFRHTFHENTPFTRRLPDGWQDTARHFRTIEWFRIDSREQFASALLQNMPICYGRSGHSICAEDLVYERGAYYVRYCDSYGTGRGDNGRLYDSERMWATGGAWACREVTLPDDPARPAGDDGL